jgi:hypothetical protein
MDNPEKLATSDALAKITAQKTKRQISPPSYKTLAMLLVHVLSMCVGHHNTQTNTHNVNKTWVKNSSTNNWR